MYLLSLVPRPRTRTREKGVWGCCLTFEGRDHDDVISRFQMKMANSSCLMMPSKAVRDILCTTEGSTPLCVVLGCIYQVYLADTETAKQFIALAKLWLAIPHSRHQCHRVELTVALSPDPFFVRARSGSGNETSTYFEVYIACSKSITMQHPLPCSMYNSAWDTNPWDQLHVRDDTCRSEMLTSE